MVALSFGLKQTKQNQQTTKSVRKFRLELMEIPFFSLLFNEQVGSSVIIGVIAIVMGIFVLCYCCGCCCCYGGVFVALLYLLLGC